MRNFYLWSDYKYNTILQKYIYYIQITFTYLQDYRCIQKIMFWIPILLCKIKYKYILQEYRYRQYYKYIQDYIYIYIIQEYRYIHISNVSKVLNEYNITHPWPFSKSKFNLKSDRINVAAPASPIITQCPGDTVQTGTGKVDPARKFKCTTAARDITTVYKITNVCKITDIH